MNKGQNYIKIKDKNKNLKNFNMYIFVDTKQPLSQLIFKNYKLRVQKLPDIYKKEGCEYIIIHCRIPKEQDLDFLKCMSELKAQMFFAGHSDYETFCESLINSVNGHTTS
jgi:hypothetical protein